MIEIRYIERTNLEPNAYKKLVKRYAKGLAHPMTITFDNRLKCYYGDYDFDGKRHLIRISPQKHHRNSRHEEIYQLLKTTLHELKHFRQWQKLKSAFWSNKYRGDDSLLEVEARAYEDTYISQAMRIYNRYKKGQSSEHREASRLWKK